LVLSNPGRAAADLESALRGSIDDWLKVLAAGGGELGALLAAPAGEQEGKGYSHTLREIAQQPVTWTGTASAMADEAELLAAALSRVGGDGGAGAILLTGSGSSLYVGECLSPALQRALGVPTQAVSGGGAPDRSGELRSLVGEDALSRGLLRPLGQQPRELRRRRLRAGSGAGVPASRDHMQRPRPPRDQVPRGPAGRDDRPRRQDLRP
jgi:hypothetical protein